MERLNSVQRSAVWKALMEVTKIVYSLDLSHSYDEIYLREVQTYSISSRLCTLIASQMGLKLKEEWLIEAPLSFLENTLRCDSEGEDDGSFMEEQMSVSDEIAEKSEEFFYEILSQTSWNAWIIEDLGDLLYMDDDEAKEMSGQIPYLMCTIWNQEGQKPQEEFQELSERFKTLGIEDYDTYEGFDTCRILNIENPILKEAVNICKKNPELAKLPEAEEIRKYNQIYLFDRTFPDCCREKDGGYIYLLGTYISDRLETSDMYYLSWVAVLGYVLMEWAAKDLLAYAEKKGVYDGPKK